jgi:hypothetical protein
MAIAALSGWTTEQKHVVVASFLGWKLEAFDCAVVGVCRDGAVARGRCLPYANHGVGRVGLDPGTFERAAAG